MYKINQDSKQFHLESFSKMKLGAPNIIFKLPLMLLNANEDLDKNCLLPLN